MAEEEIAEHQVGAPLGEDDLVRDFVAHPLDGSEARRLRRLELPASPSPEAMALLESELQAAIASAHEGLIRPLRAGTHQGQPFLLTELPHAARLEALLEAGGPLSVELVARLGLDLTLALARLHGGSPAMVHLGITPRAVLLGLDGKARLDGLPLGGLFKASGAQIAQSMTYGCAYFSPEQVRAGELDPKTDLFSLGSCLYQALVGEPPFTAPTPLGITIRISMGRYAPLQKHKPDLPPPLRELIHRMLSADPSARPSAAEASEVLGGLLSRDNEGSLRATLGERASALLGSDLDEALSDKGAHDDRSTFKQEEALDPELLAAAVKARAASKAPSPAAPSLAASSEPLEQDDLRATTQRSMDPARLAAAQAARREAAQQGASRTSFAGPPPAAPGLEDEFDSRSTLARPSGGLDMSEVELARQAIRSRPTPAERPAPRSSSGAPPPAAAQPLVAPRAPSPSEPTIPVWAWIAIAVGAALLLIIPLLLILSA